jgi:hypothetical protein
LHLSGVFWQQSAEAAVYFEGPEDAIRVWRCRCAGGMLLDLGFDGDAS